MKSDIIRKLEAKAEDLAERLAEQQAKFLNRLPGGRPDDEWLDVTDVPGAAVFMATPFVIRGEGGRWYARSR